VLFYRTNRTHSYHRSILFPRNARKIQRIHVLFSTTRNCCRSSWTLIQLDIPILELDKPLDVATYYLVKSKKQSTAKLGQPLVDIIMINRKRTGEHRISFRMSHAAYDGSSFPIIWRVIQSLYEGRTETADTNFSTYVSDLQSRIRGDSHQY
jgi:hypothetical protein